MRVLTVLPLPHCRMWSANQVHLDHSYKLRRSCCISRTQGGTRRTFGGPSISYHPLETRARTRNSAGVNLRSHLYPAQLAVPASPPRLLVCSAFALALAIPVVVDRHGSPGPCLALKRKSAGRGLSTVEYNLIRIRLGACPRAHNRALCVWQMLFCCLPRDDRRYHKGRTSTDVNRGWRLVVANWLVCGWPEH